MINIINKIMKGINLGLIVFLIIMLPGYFLIMNYLKIYVYYYQILQFVLPFQIIICIYNLIVKNIKINKYDIFIYFLFLMGVLTTISSVDVHTSIWGAYLRNEGLITISTYYLMFLNAKSLSKREIKWVLNTLIFVGVIQFIYSFLQVFVRGEYIYTYSKWYGDSTFSHMAIGFVGNGNMLGSFCILLLGICLGLYLLQRKKIYFFLTIIFYINLLLAQSTGPFLSFIVLFLMTIIILTIKKIINWKKVVLLFSVFTIIFFVIIFGGEKYCKEVFHDEMYSAYTIKGDLINTFSILFGKNKIEEEDKDGFVESTEIQIEEEDKDGFVEFTETKIEEDNDYIENSNYGSGRLTIWKNCLKIIPKYFWYGSGIDTFGYVYYNYNVGSYTDKAHNEYLQILVTEGIFTLIGYLSLLICLFIDGIKSRDSLVLALTFGFVGYAIQAFMNISIPTVAPFYFLVCGLLANTVSIEKKA